MMFEDDPILRPARQLEDMSLEELAARIETLKEEINLCEAEIRKKRAVKDSANDIFN